MSYESERVISELVEILNTESDIEFIAQLGDISQDDLRYPSVEFDRENFKRALFYFSKFKAAVHHTVGNHDRENLTYEDLCSLLKREKLHYSFDVADYHCIFLYTRHFNHSRMIIEQDQTEWLKADLAATKRKTLVFMHHPISDQDLKGSFWFEGAPHKAFVENREDVRAILESSGKVIGVFNGHLHRNNLWKHNGIPYFTIQSCVEDVTNTGVPSKSYAIVSVDGDKVSIEVHGGDPARLSL
jgi:predicted phosphodiesterase